MELKAIDISVSVSSGLPVWPGTPAVEFIPLLDGSTGNGSVDTVYRASLHAGTHIDAPAHYIVSGRKISEVALDVFVGDAFVADFSHAGPGSLITGDDLERKMIDSRARRLLLRTANSRLWSGTRGFETGYTALDVSAADWLAQRGMLLVGIDYFSIERFDGDGSVHRRLLSNDVIVLESIDLAMVREGWYRLVCLPIKMHGVEAAPARAVLFPAEDGKAKG